MTTGTRAQVAEIADLLAEAEDLARLGHHLALLGRVVVAVLEGLDLRQDVEGDLVRVDLGAGASSPVEHRLRLRAQLLDRPLAGAGDRLVGGDDQALDAGRVVDRRERHHHLHRRAVRVGDDALVAVDRVGVDLGDDQRHVVVHPPVAGVVDDDRAGLDQLRRPLGADRAAGRGEDEVEALDRLLAQRPALELAAPFHSISLARRSAREANGTTSAAGKSRSASTSRMVEPTAPVAPRTPTL